MTGYGKVYTRPRVIGAIVLHRVMHYVRTEFFRCSTATRIRFQVTGTAAVRRDGNRAKLRWPTSGPAIGSEKPETKEAGVLGAFLNGTNRTCPHHSTNSGACSPMNGARTWIAASRF